MGILSWFGSLERRILTPGLTFVPYFWRIRVIRIPKKQYKFFFRASEEDEMYSKDRQLLFPDIAGWLRLPYDDIDSLIRFIESGIETEEAALERRIKEEVVGVVKNVLAEYNHNELIGTSKLEEIFKKVRDALFGNNRLFCRSGICGKDWTDLTAGTGEVVIRVETIRLTNDLNQAMGEPVINRYKAKAATAVGQKASNEILGMVARQVGLTVKELAERLKADVSLAGKPSKDGGFKEAFEHSRSQTRLNLGTGEGVTYHEEQVVISTGKDQVPLEPNVAAAIVALRELSKARNPGQPKNPPGSKPPRKK